MFNATNKVILKTLIFKLVILELILMQNVWMSISLRKSLMFIAYMDLQRQLIRVLVKS